MSKTLVIFRKYSSGDIIAIFPHLPSSNSEHECLSYSIFGDRGGHYLSADPLLYRALDAASPAEYADLARELTKLGYNLKIGKRVPQNSLEIRRKSLKR
jgi:hypothetical protein